MNYKLKWKKGFFSSTYGLFSNDKPVGELKGRAFSQSADGNLNGIKYSFRAKGVFKQHTEIVDGRDSKVIGKIAFNTMMTKATISFLNKEVNWKYDNLWSTKWRIFDSGEIEIKYQGSTTSGQIDSNSDDALLLLSGLYVTNYYWQFTFLIIIAVFVPLWATVLN
jgi:hypothetical protein